jgi:hypothetical protein
MAYTTKYSIAEQVLRRVKAGRPDLATKLDIEDLIIMVPQIAAKEMKAGYFGQTLPTGETIPDGLMLVKYNLPVNKTGTKHTIELPARPIHLPRGMGLFEIADPENPYAVFIPAISGQLAMLGSQSMISDLGGSNAYEPDSGNKVAFYKPVGPDTLSVRLFIADIGSLSDTDPIPVPQDIELAIVDALYERFIQEPPANKNNDLLTDNKIQ